MKTERSVLQQPIDLGRWKLYLIGRHWRVLAIGKIEEFNLPCNTMVVGSLGWMIGNSSAGRATNIANTPHELQFGVEVVF